MNDHQPLKDRLTEVKFIVDGLVNHEPFNRFVKLFDEDCQRADETWHNCIVENEEGRNLFYQLRASKLSIINIKNKLEELKNEVIEIEAELLEEQDE